MRVGQLSVCLLQCLKVIPLLPPIIKGIFENLSLKCKRDPQMSPQGPVEGLLLARELPTSPY